jgi:hypothetical protein
VFKILETSEYCSSMVLKFKRKTNILLTVVYLPHDSKERKSASKLIHSTIRMARQNNFHHIITGDFNSYPKNSPAIQAHTTSSKQAIYNLLSSYVDVGFQFNKRAFTHFTSSSASRIDQIWISKNLASKIIWYKVQESEIITSDHHIVSAKLDWFEFKEIKATFKYNVNKTSKDSIAKFRDDLDLWIETSQPSDWDTFDYILKNSMSKHIKKERVNMSQDSHLTKAEKTLKRQVKIINKTLSAIKSSPVQASDILDETLMNLYQVANHNVLLSTPGLRKLKKLLIKESLAQSQQELAEELRDKIQKSVTNFYRKPKDYIKKALNLLKPKIDLKKLYDGEGNLEDDPDLIKDIINKHFQKILCQRSFDLHKFSNWQETYSIQNHVNQDIYNHTISPFTLQDLEETIRGLPKNKAPGLSEVTYDLVKLFGKSTKESLIAIFNSILSSCSILRS